MTNPQERPARSRSGVDIAIGAVVAAIGIGVIIYASGLARLNTGAIGAGLFPTVIGIFMVLFGGILLIQGLRGSVQDPAGGQTEAARAAGENPWRLILNGAAVVGVVVAYLLLADAVGFIPLMIILLALLQIVLGARVLSAVIVAVVATAVLYVVFEQMLLVQLPNGILGF